MIRSRRSPAVAMVMATVALAALAAAALACGESQSEVVTGPAPRTISIWPAQLDIAVGQTGQFQASVSGMNGGRIVWASSAPATASVDQTGRVTGLAAGEASITATLDGTEWRVTARVRVAAAP